MTSSLFVPELHPRIRERLHAKPTDVGSKEPPRRVLGPFNSRLGLKITVAVGSMWAAYAFTALSLISLPSALKSGSLIVIIGWIAQTFLQLVLLPIIIVGQNIQGVASDKRAQATFDDAEALMHINQQIQTHMLAQDEAIEAILSKLEIKLVGGSPEPPTTKITSRERPS